MGFTRGISVGTDRVQYGHNLTLTAFTLLVGMSNSIISSLIASRNYSWRRPTFSAHAFLECIVSVILMDGSANFYDYTKKPSSKQAVRKP